MKIFAWIHRKKHANADYSMIPSDKDLSKETKKTPTAAATAKDTDALLLLQTLGEGFLSIGTFGMDDQMQTLESYVGSIAREEDEEFPFQGEQQTTDKPKSAVRLLKEELDLEDALDSNPTGEEVLESQPLMTSRSDNSLHQFLDPVVSVAEDGAGEILEEKKGRMTLAELFMADSFAADATTDVALDTTPAGTAKTSVRRGSGRTVLRSFTKKFLPGKAKENDPNSASKFQRLMKRISRKQVHPDMLERKTSKRVSTTCSAASASGFGPTSECGASYKEQL